MERDDVSLVLVNAGPHMIQAHIAQLCRVRQCCCVIMRSLEATLCPLLATGRLSCVGFRKSMAASSSKVASLVGYCKRVVPDVQPPWLVFETSMRRVLSSTATTDNVDAVTAGVATKDAAGTTATAAAAAKQLSAGAASDVLDNQSSEATKQIPATCAKSRPRDAAVAAAADESSVETATLKEPDTPDVTSKSQQPLPKEQRHTTTKDYSHLYTYVTTRRRVIGGGAAGGSDMPVSVGNIEPEQPVTYTTPSGREKLVTSADYDALMRVKSAANVVPLLHMSLPSDELPPRIVKKGRRLAAYGRKASATTTPGGTGDGATPAFTAGARWIEATPPQHSSFKYAQRAPKKSRGKKRKVQDSGGNQPSTESEQFAKKRRKAAQPQQGAKKGRKFPKSNGTKSAGYKTANVGKLKANPNRKGKKKKR